MFKVGDEIICIDNKRLNNVEISIGKKYKVLSLGNNYYNDYQSSVLIANDNNYKAHYYSSRFKLVTPRVKPITEIEFLDCFQKNFREEY